MTPAEFKTKWAKFSGKESAAYGFPTELPDDEILSRLLALNLERAAEESQSAAQTKPKSQRPKAVEEML